MGIVFGVVSYALSGVAAVIDKYLLGGRIPHAGAYAFLVGILGLFAFALVPFGFSVLPAPDLVLALLSGIVFIGALLAFYEALRCSDASRVVPLTGALIPVCVIFFSWIGYGAVPTLAQLGATALFVAGGLFLAPRNGAHTFKTPAIVLAVVAGGLLAFSFLLLIEVFRSSPFLSAFIWSRLGSALAAGGLLAFPAVRKAVADIMRHAPHSSYAIFFLNKGIGAASFFILNYALALGPGGIVAALKGFEYFTVFLIAILATHFAPRLIREEFNMHALVIKAVGIGMLTLGFIVLTFA